MRNILRELDYTQILNLTLSNYPRFHGNQIEQTFTTADSEAVAIIPARKRTPDGSSPASGAYL